MSALSTYHPPGELLDAPSGIIAAAGDVWFTSIGDARVGRVVVATGEVQTFADPAGHMSLPANIFPGVDGRVWFTSLGSDSVCAIDPDSPDPSATMTSVALEPGCRPVALKSDHDGMLWFTLRGIDAVGSLDPRAEDPAATVRIHRSDMIAAPAALYVATDRGIRWVNSANGRIGILDRSTGDISAIGPWPEFGMPRAWAETPDGRLWLTTRDPAGLLVIDPADPASAPRWVRGDHLREPDGVCVGADGALWIADTAADAIVRWDPRTLEWSSHGSAPEVAGPFDIKPGPDGAVWFTNKAGGTIGRLAL